MSRVAKAYKNDSRRSTATLFNKSKHRVLPQRPSDRSSDNCLKDDIATSEGEIFTESENLLPDPLSQKFSASLDTVGEGSSAPHKLWNAGLGDSSVSFFFCVRESYWEC